MHLDAKQTDTFWETVEELYDRAPCGYLSTTPDGRIVRANRTLADWIGAERDELTRGTKFIDLLTIGGKIFYETHFALLLQMHGRVDEIALDLVCRQGGVVPTLVTAVQNLDATGMPLVNRITVFNATERRSYERELLAARKRAEEAAAELVQANSKLARSNAALLKANEELGHFVYAANHDLQEPLRTATVYAQLLARECAGVLDETARHLIENIVQSTGRMQMLVRDLLSFSEAGGAPLVLRHTDLNRTLIYALENLASAIDESGAVVTHEALPCLTADAARIAQVFQNLIGNAIKYRKPEDQPRVCISATREQREWVISVEDNGVGFEPEYADQVFQMFKRLHGREVSGTGIGLAICKKIVELHGGRIWAKSAPGVGSCFSFTLPEAAANNA